MPRTKPSGETRLDQALSRLYQFFPLKIDLSLGRLERLLKHLANPERKLPLIIHVAGTNGKGSVVAFLRAILEAAGLRVHVYTSPHLVSFRERIRIAGNLIGEDNLVDILGRVEAANNGQPITFFEVTTAAAFLAFSETPADVCLLEVGLGGRLDATNVIEKPLVTIITPVGLDHAVFLGDDLKSVAREKAGIAKAGVPLVAAAQQARALAVIENQARKVGAPLLLEGRNWRLDGLEFSGFGKSITLPRPALAGEHQAHNAALAVAALFAQSAFKVSGAAIRQGVRTTSWPARFQKLRTEDFSISFPKGTEIWLDGGHNPLAGRALAKLLPGVLDRERPRFLIAGMMESKDREGFLALLAPLFDFFTAVPVPGKDKGAAPEQLCRAARGLGFETTKAGNVNGALKKISARAKEPAPQILITGSLYLAGQVLRDIGYSVS
ncbi:MAG: bifunctional folylpolyglutamate synthase/dihydrofolate synthase [Proteobacteria bacterium]|nr:bifunctional folylpolyglutamate synthase/dihydrofolate synthase [Pseudomonadota bacterium]